MTAGEKRTAATEDQKKKILANRVLLKKKGKDSRIKEKRKGSPAARTRRSWKKEVGQFTCEGKKDFWRRGGGKSVSWDVQRPPSPERQANLLSKEGGEKKVP